MDDVRHLEYQVTDYHYDKDKKFVIDAKTPTKRGSVSITEDDAMQMNYDIEATKRLYVLDEEAAKRAASDFSRMNKQTLIDYITDNALEIDIDQTKANLIKAIKEAEADK